MSKCTHSRGRLYNLQLLCVFVLCRLLASLLVGRLKERLKEKLMECGWFDDLKAHCKGMSAAVDAYVGTLMGVVWGGAV